MKIKIYQLIIVIALCLTSHAQEIKIFEQFNGKYDFTFVGNTLNKEENSFGECDILSSSSATLNLDPESKIEKVYLYWAGSGPGDDNVSLNNLPITAERKFALIAQELIPATGEIIDRPFFSAFSDVTEIVKQQGNTTYTLSDIDLSEAIDEYYCKFNINFGGWALLVVFKNESFPLYQLNVYDGFEAVPEKVTINLDNLNVIDNQNARIGFIAWEGDRNLSINETLRINNNIISNPPLNPPTNAFNGTNSITGNDQLYNMDLDIYSIENNINIGDTNAQIELTSDRDVIFINTVITRLNSQLPDARVHADDHISVCGNRDVALNFSVSNTNSTAILPKNTPIELSINGEVLETLFTTNDLDINTSEDFQSSITIPENYGDSIIIIVNIDPDNITPEINEDNNTHPIAITFKKEPIQFNTSDLETCDLGGTVGSFDLTKEIPLLGLMDNETVTFHETLYDATLNTNSIDNITNYTSTQTEKTIHLRLTNGYCYNTGTFKLIINECLPDAEISIIPHPTNCGSRKLTLDLVVTNKNSTALLPAQTPIDLTINNDIIQTLVTSTDIMINGNEIITTTIDIPDQYGATINLVGTIDPQSTLNEIDESNNQTDTLIILHPALNTITLSDLTSCNTGESNATFDLDAITTIINPSDSFTITYHNTIDDANNNINKISNTSTYAPNQNQKTIYVRIDNQNCYQIESFILNSIDCLPDASIDLIQKTYQCGTRIINYDIVVANLLGINPLPKNTLISILANGISIQTISTDQEVAIGTTQTINTTLSIPDELGTIFNLTAIIDSNNLIKESNENNNSTTYITQLEPIQSNITTPELITCNVGNLIGTFNLIEYQNQLNTNNEQSVSFFNSLNDATNQINPIIPITNYTSNQTKKTLFVRVQNGNCYQVTPIILTIKDCLPDASVTFKINNNQCNNPTLNLELTIFNLNSEADLPQATPIDILINNTQIITINTPNPIPIEKQETLPINVTLPSNLGNSITIEAIIDPLNSITEINESNNNYSIQQTIDNTTNLTLKDLNSCNIGNNQGYFNLNSQSDSFNHNNSLTYHTTLSDAENGSNPILNTEQYLSKLKNEIIYTRTETSSCYAINSFKLHTNNCPPEINNFISPNNDNINDRINFNPIDGAYPNIEIEIYSRWGQLVWRGNYENSIWDGIANQGAIPTGGGDLPGGTYFYIINLNDKDHSKALTGYLYLSKK